MSCNATCRRKSALLICDEPFGHDGPHRAGEQTWTDDVERPGTYL